MRYIGVTGSPNFTKYDDFKVWLNMENYQLMCRVYDDELQANVNGFYTFTNGGLLLHKIGSFNDFIKQ